MVNLVAPETVTDQSGQSRPISGDTLGGYRREQIPLEHIKSNHSHSNSQTGSARRSPQRRGSSPLNPLNTETVMPRRGSSPLNPLGTNPVDASASDGMQVSSQGEDIIHGGLHLSQTTNKLDPHIQGALPIKETYQAGPDVEAGLHPSKPAP